MIYIQISQTDDHIPIQFNSKSHTNHTNASLKTIGGHYTELTKNEDQRCVLRWDLNNAWEHKKDKDNWPEN